MLILFQVGIWAKQNSACASDVSSSSFYVQGLSNISQHSSVLYWFWRTFHGMETTRGKPLTKRFLEK